MSEKMMLYHGTTDNVARTNDDIFGKVIRNYPELSGNLTDNLDCAWVKADIRRKTIGGLAAVIVFSIPTIHLVHHGLILFEEQALGFSTNFVVERSEIPVSFLFRTHLSVATIDMEPNDNIYFYRIPREYQNQILYR